MIRKTAIFCMMVITVFAVASCSKDSTGIKDTTPPRVSLVSPWDGVTREGVVDVSVDSYDESGIKRVELYVGGKLHDTVTTPPYTFAWDMSSIADGVITSIYAKAVDTKGNTKITPEVNVTKGESEPPDATLTGPADGTEVMQGYLVVLSGSATDPEDVTLGDDNIIWSSNLQGTFAKGREKDYRGFVIGTHTITMTAIDSDGNTDVETRTITVTENDQPFAYIQEGAYTIGPPVFEPRTVWFDRPFIVSKYEFSLGEFIAAYDYFKNPSDNFDETTQKELISLEKTKFQNRGSKFVAEETGYPEDLLTDADKYGEYPACFYTLYECIHLCQVLSDKDGFMLPYEFLDKENRNKEECLAQTGTEMKPSKYVKAVIVDGANGWRLPTEAEWEVAASGGSNAFKYPWGNEYPSSRCNSLADITPPEMVVLANGRGITKVNSYGDYKNLFGLNNITGNVAEMCSDIFIGLLPSGIDYVGYSEASPVNYVVKGGTWYQSGEAMQIPLRSVYIPFDRLGSAQNAYNSGFGIRLVRNLEPGDAPW